jgi:3D (Asp-Asp-Asp) domain-containing protein
VTDGGGGESGSVGTGDDGGGDALAVDGAQGGGSVDAGGASDADAGGSDGSPGSGLDASGLVGDSGGDAGGDASVMMSVYVTFYGWADNSPPGGAIAYPMNGGYPTLRNAAGGTGTYADPITFATDKNELPVGTRVYVPFIEKYVIMEDDCAQCDTDWTTSHKWHIDLWMNSNGTESSAALQTCEGNWTRASTVIEVNPPAGRAVTTRPLFDPSTNTCRTTP